MATPQHRKKTKPDPLTVAELFTRLRAANPQPTTELEYQSPFQLLVAVILSAQTTDRAVNLATRPLFARAPDARALLALGEDGLADAVKTIGLYKTKARHVIATCRQLLELYDGAVPARREQLEALPGVGRKTANVVLNTAFGESTMAVDTHIFRLAHRLGLSQGKTPVAVEQDLLTRIPADFLKDAHHWLILHGRYVCKARKPECWRCRLNDLCPFPDKTEAAGTPVPLDLAPAPAVTSKRASAARPSRTKP
ncbi:MAG TPA: endonuclease III [Rhodocyclaceae bacterium]|nr:endonuclease III [Rhodocyclaceae bacterium]